jgi:hypothetical protein
MISDYVDFLRYYGGHFENGGYFQNGRHNIANIQYCPISQFDMWVDNDVLN